MKKPFFKIFYSTSTVSPTSIFEAYRTYGKLPFTKTNYKFYDFFNDKDMVLSHQTEGYELYEKPHIEDYEQRGADILRDINARKSN